MLKVHVTIHDTFGKQLKSYLMDHDDAGQRRVLGEQCRAAFEAGQAVTTRAIKGQSKAKASK